MILMSSLEGVAIWNPGLKEWNVFLNGLRVYEECCETNISLFVNSNNYLVVRISSEKCFCKLARATNLFKYHHYHHKQENLKTYAGIFLSLKTERAA